MLAGKRHHRYFVCFIFFIFIFIIHLQSSFAHHGGVSTAFGPGAPIETASPLALGKGNFLLFEKFEYVPFEHRDHAEPENIDTFTFFNTLVGYGFTDALSVYATLPVAIKDQDNLGMSSGLGDLGFIVQYGFKIGERDGIRGLYSYGPEDSYGEEYSTDDIKMSLLAGFTVPSGTTSNRNDKGNTFDMGMQPGFGAPSFNFGFAASKMIFPQFTLTGDTSLTTFTEHNDGKPGNEIRFNVAGGYEIYEKENGFLSRLDIIAESNMLHLTKDENEDREKEDDTGGTILYFSPGLRATFSKYVSVGVLIKLPTWKDLNNESDQQGAEGLEEYRAIVTCSISF
ncbi:MAG: transporter [Candidatus Jettenia sp.]|uniref:Transporter n=1 Tax=Candidatus Jettenia caeni TaxID=247490 RepID=I3IKY6_9BACT|nr:transporter [Candidatus Jettenia sp. AMX1]MBC6929346.1 transporter [Candidatus Jettenia sp.]NUN22688.1 transporter [Candidatus Jettenia caeni]KAA0249641.1 MAG: transporter [Candidatus Jettenia sp. AMX1]MCE7880741.1 transporter [Candidatus Jettenia sp. AMX1]MCQ3927577.1 transporter [Candidatus Jettenia sp.]